VTTSRRLARILLLLVVSGGAIRGETKLPYLQVGDDVYTNVTVTSVTPTDIYFSHRAGLGTAKLKSLEPELQRRFHFDPAKAAVIEEQRAGGNFAYRQAIKQVKPAAAVDGAEGSDEIPPHELAAKSFLNRPSPTVVAEKWLTPMPNPIGKFILLDFWATWSGPSTNTIPELNAFQEKFKDRLVVVGLSDETEQTVRNLAAPQIKYANAIDPEHRASLAYGVERIPHAVLVDPKGIVRFEGHPGYLDERKLGALLDKYAD